MTGFKLQFQLWPPYQVNNIRNSIYWKCRCSLSASQTVLHRSGQIHRIRQQSGARDQPNLCWLEWRFHLEGLTGLRPEVAWTRAHNFWFPRQTCKQSRTLWTQNILLHSPGVTCNVPRELRKRTVQEPNYRYFVDKSF